MKRMHVITAALLSLPCICAAQAYPAKPVRMVLAVAGGAEAVARIVAQRIAGPLGQPVIVDPQSGAGGAVGAEMVARATPDGHTILLAAVSTQVVRVFVTKNTPYDPIRDFTPITQVADTVVCIVANPSLPASSLKELIDYARRNPGKVSYGSSGIGTAQHLSFEMLKQLTGADIVHVPYKSGNQSLAALLGGEIPLATSILATTSSHIKAGKLKLLALIDTKRYPVVPNVPTVTEVVPEFEAMPAWMGFFGPGRLPAAIQTRLHDEMVKALSAPDVRAKAEEIGFVVQTSTPDEFAAKIKRDLGTVGRIVKAVKYQPTE
jgi:tripartite-type tricarboxylate transporter receptor subunit TctC